MCRFGDSRLAPAKYGKVQSCGDKQLVLMEATLVVWRAACCDWKRGK